MTLSTTTSRATYAGNGVTTIFSFPYRFLVNGDLEVTLVDADGVATTQVLTTNYTVTGADLDAGGSVTMIVAPAVGQTLVIRRVVDLTQETDYNSGDAFPAETHERALDKLTMMDQQLQEQVDRSITVPLDNTTFSGQLPEIVAGTFVRVNDSGTGMEFVTALDPGELVVSPFIETLLDDANAAAARTTLGAQVAGSYQPAGSYANSGAVGSSGLTMATDRVLGRVSASTGAVEELTRAQMAVRETSKIQPITASVGSNALTITLNPTTLDFRSATLGSGTVNTRTVASAISVVVSSGSTLGTISAQVSRLVVLAIDNAGTVELAVINLAGGANLDECGLISTTAEGGAGAADSSTVAYSTTARSSVPYRVVGFVESTQATAGTWATAPSTIQGHGGQALTSLQSLGYGQTYQLVTRTAGTTYYNTTGKPIHMVVNINAAAAASCSVNIAINGGSAITFVSSSAGTGPTGCAGSIVIPPGASYVLGNVNVTAQNIYELR